jgi:hypothetical protein
MYKVLLSTFFVLSFFVFSTQAQSYRLRSLADNLQRNIYSVIPTIWRKKLIVISPAATATAGAMSIIF